MVYEIVEWENWEIAESGQSSLVFQRVYDTGECVWIVSEAVG
jgi:hypothetical protein